MSETHLADLRRALEQHHWVIANELDGNGYNISGVWVITRPDGSGMLHLEFEGLDDMKVLPMNKAYGCRLREERGISAYFCRKDRSWPKELDRFFGLLNEWSG